MKEIKVKNQNAKVKNVKVTYFVLSLLTFNFNPHD